MKKHLERQNFRVKHQVIVSFETLECNKKLITQFCKFTNTVLIVSDYHGTLAEVKSYFYARGSSLGQYIKGIVLYNSKAFTREIQDDTRHILVKEKPNKREPLLLVKDGNVILTRQVSFNRNLNIITDSLVFIDELDGNYASGGNS